VADSAKFFDSQEEEMQPTFEFAPKKSFWQSLGWGVAALACIALAVNVYLTRLQPLNNQAGNIPPVTQTPTPKPNVNQQLEQFLASDRNVIKAEVAKADPKSPVEITGDIVWSAEKQEGFMRLRGLPANDPTKSTYQLWIFDEAQDEKYPVDGGVFDVNMDGEIIIPIDAKINIKNPKLFAVTKEKPGGVVVSDRKGIVAVAKV
jgi:anti-sigma-K factor RskA